MVFLQAWGLNMETDLSPKGAKLIECHAELSLFGGPSEERRGADGEQECLLAWGLEFP